MNIVEERRALVEDVMSAILKLAADGVNRGVLERVRQELLRLAARKELFPPVEFPSVAGEMSSMYRLYQRPDHSFALAVASPAPSRSTPPHLHRTWAVIAGIHGREHNRLYEQRGDEVVQVGELDVVYGQAHAMMPDDIHSIHLGDDGPHLMLHLYGMSIEHIHDRAAYDFAQREWKVFPAAKGVKSAAGAL